MYADFLAYNAVDVIFFVHPESGNERVQEFALIRSNIKLLYEPVFDI